MTLDDFLTTRLDALLRFARVVTGDRAAAEDAVQDVVVQLLRDPGRVERIADLDAYARRMVVNGFISWRRKWSRIRPVALVPDRSASPAAALDEIDALRGRLTGLPPRQRAVLALRYLFDLDDAAIARELGCSEGTVRSHASRALATLRVAATVHAEERA